MVLPHNKTGAASTKQAGDAAEDAALQFLQRHGLRLLERNYRTPGRGGASHGGAAASISATKQQRIVFAARHYLMRLRTPPACRFDVVLIEPSGIELLPAAFEAC